ncbi:hypothetical protein KZO85_12190 [Chromohalobacter canadensis]|uniref:hypothetical protein n=1 Tax=Chromohalobacter canadensis TaxID=141389 RepID=UPI0021C1CA86|nr:hypothetical protein [Chromohalobacter canadensis]MCT8469343.1 hypothetical protein [Chromohalobacter canadensis]MCT8471967.1 hypothetical protein [Chromohalobacter canadensis]MCT8499920.1 hypothetical protein [Chromohalobacter canadensis]
MSRVNEVIAHEVPEGVFDTYGIENAFCNCLNSEEATELLNRVVTEKPAYRNAAVKKVCSDIEKDFLGCHEQLVEDLTLRFESADHRLRQSLGTVLSRLSEVAPSFIEQKIELFFLQSRYVGVRRRGYKIAARRDKLDEQAVLKAWHEHSDYEAAWLITKFFPVFFLIENIKDIEQHFTEGWQFARLYLRIAEVQPNLLPRLKDRDPISYCYVLVKTGIEISDDEAFDIMESASQDERFGLFVWSLGKAGKWDVLKNIDSKLLEIQERRAEQLMKQHGS